MYAYTCMYYTLCFSVCDSVCVCYRVVFIQLCHGLSPDVPVWDFSPVSHVHRCFGCLVFSHLPSLSSRHCSCETGNAGVSLILPGQSGNVFRKWKNWGIFHGCKRWRLQYQAIHVHISMRHYHSYFFLKSFLNELLKPPLSCFRLLSLKGVWLFSSVPPLHFDSSPHDWNPESWWGWTQYYISDMVWLHLVPFMVFLSPEDHGGCIYNWGKDRGHCSNLNVANGF